MNQGDNQHRRILTVLESREGNWPLVDDLQNSAESRGWKLERFKKINSDRIARFDFDIVPLDYVIFRDLSGSGYVETERVFEWLKVNNKIAMNINTTGGRAFTSDKHFQQGMFILDQHLKEYALPTFEAKTKENVIDYIRGGRVKYPIVLKQRWGSIGKGIILIRNEQDLDKIKDFKGFLIEQYIEPECDFRVFVIGGATVGIMRKTGDPKHPDNFKAWSAGIDKNKEEDQDTIEFLSGIACRAAAVARLEYAGVDVIREKGTGKYYLLEVNVSAGWMNFTPGTGINIPDLVLDWFVDMADGREMPKHKAIQQYIKHREQYLPRTILKRYKAILNGEPKASLKCRKQFETEETKYLYSTGYLFNELSKAYEAVVSGESITKYEYLLKEIEKMPLSWTGNMIGPECGTLTEGAILSALYLYLLGKMHKV